MHLTNLDVPRILSFGVIGLGFLLALLAFGLQRKQAKSKGAIGFMVFAIVLVCAGLASEWLRFQNLTPKPWSEMPGAPIPCAARPGWPTGEWYLWGRFDDHKPTPENTDKFTRIPQIFPQAVFTSDHSYRSETEQGAETGQSNQMDRAYEAAAQDGQKLAPGASVTFTGHDNTKPKRYEMTETLTVTANGCMLTGRWSDNVGNFGSENYLYRSEIYYVPPRTD